MFVFANMTYPSSGGAENLVINLAKFIYQFTDVPVKIFASEESYVYRRIKNEKIPAELIEINQSPSAHVDENDILILFGNNENLKDFLSTNCNVLIYNILSLSILNWNRLNIERRIFNSSIIKDFLNKKLLTVAISKNSLVAMDSNTRNDINVFLRTKRNIPLIPIPIFPIENLYITYQRNFYRNRISMTYIGRGDDEWKINPLKNIFRDLGKVNYQIDFHIITNQTNLYQSILSQYITNNIHIKYHLNLFGKSLKEFLITNADLNIGMGTSALESGSLGIPTILIDASITNLPQNYKYQFLFESSQYCLGSFLDPTSPVEHKHSLQSIIELIENLESRTELSKKTIQYVETNHHPNVTVKKLLSLQPTMRIADVVKYSASQWKIAHPFNRR
jgi:hypothetical protein